MGCLLFACWQVRAQTPGQPQITLDPSGASVTAGSAITLTATATDAFVARLSLWEPALALQPQVQTLSQNSNLVLQAVAGGSPPLAYQWFLNGTGLAGATGSSLLVPNAQFSNAGVYSVQASNTAGTVSSLAAVVNILPRLAVSRSNDTPTSKPPRISGSGRRCSPI